MSVLFIDVGSSSVRTGLITETLTLLDKTIYSQAYRFTSGADGGATVDAVQLRTMVENCIDQTLAASGSRSIQAVGMSTFVGNLMGVDTHNAPTTPIYSYADTRGADTRWDLEQRLDMTATYQRTGCPPHSSYHPFRLRWLQNTQPRRYENTHLWLDFATYCYRTWFNRDVPCSTSIASWSGLLNRHECAWDGQLLAALEMHPADFPNLADFSKAQTGLSTAYAGRWSPLRAIPWYLAVGDGAAANVGSGGTDPSRPVLTVGTTAALRVTTTETVTAIPTGLWCYRIDRERQLLGGATTEGGNIFAWASHTLRLEGDIEQALAQQATDSHGLTVLPLLAGERSPGYDASARGIIQGLQLSTTPLDILQASLEGVAVRLAVIADMLVDESVAFYAGGGALYRSPAWTQIIANAFNRTIYLLSEAEVTARGIAALILNRENQTPRIKATITPTPEDVQALKQVRDRLSDLH